MTERRAGDEETAELRERLVQTERRLAAAEAERARLEGEVDLRAERIQALGEELKRARADLRRLQRRRAVRYAVALADWSPLRRAGRGARASVRTLRALADLPALVVRRRLRALRRSRGGLLLLGLPAGHHRLRASPGAAEALAEELRREAPSDLPTAGPRVSVLILNRNGRADLERCLASLGQLAYRDVELVIVDNGSSDGSLAFVEGWSSPFPLRLIRYPENRSFAEANNAAASAATGELLLLLNNDVEAVDGTFLGAMVQTLEADPTTAAVGARLVYPRRSGPPSGPRSLAADLTLQHRGIGFEIREGVVAPRNLGVGEDPRGHAARQVTEVPAATAACLLVRRAAWSAIGGLFTGYDYGMEDVDLCLALRRAGGRIVYDGRAVLWHRESGTQLAEPRAARGERQARNRALLLDRWAPAMFREALGSLIAARDPASPLHVGITVSRDDPAAGYGDWYTAHELGAALEELGWRVSYPERAGDRWYELDSGLHVLIVLLDAFDLRRIPPGIVTVAWVRNWTDRWLERPWFSDYDLVLASSGRSKALIEAGSAKTAELLPLATNPARFQPGPPVAELVASVVMTSNRWGRERPIEHAARALAAHELASAPVRGSGGVALYGRGWEELPELAPIRRGELPYARLPELYRSAGVVVDDTAEHTAPYAAVNSRVFDALAAGAIVVTDNAEGVAELFDGDFPIWRDPAALPDLAAALLSDPVARATAERHRQTVLARHTYAHRASRLRELLAGWTAATRVGIRIGVPSWEVAPAWGDTHFGRDLQRQLERRSRPARLRILPDWDHAATARDDVVVHLFGLSRARTRPGQVNLLWVISHPDRVEDGMLAGYDAILAASDVFAAELAGRTDRPVVALHQATDPERFRPAAGGPHHDLLFVANSRGVRRRIVAELTPTERDLAVYGRGWTADLLDPRYLRGELVPNAELHRFYSAAEIVLNDHWDDMRRHGFFSNRLYDALAAGAFVISDDVPGIAAEFDGGVVTFESGAELRALVERYLADPAARRAHAERGRAAVLARHTFAARTETLLAVADPFLDARRRVAPER